MDGQDDTAGGERAPAPGDATWFSDVEAPLRVSDGDAAVWHRSVDLLVVGYGGAGVCAALEARAHGLSVFAVDRFAGGGATRINGGVFYAGGGTAAQTEAGVVDTVEDMYRYLRIETAGVVGDATLRRFCETSVENADWLARHGVRFAGRLYTGKTSFPHTDHTLYHSDNSLAPPYAAVARPAARGHRALVDRLEVPMGYGKGLYDPLRAAAERAGVDFLGSATVRRLVVGDDGAVIGAEVTEVPAGTPEAERRSRLLAAAAGLVMRTPPTFPGAGLIGRIAAGKAAEAREIERRMGVSRLVRARRGVCLSAGGFVFNRDMVRHYAPNYLQGMPLGTPGDDGSGIRLGESVGGRVDRMSHLSAWRFVNPPHAWAHGMIVDATGRRYVDEMLYGASIGRVMVEEAGGVAWIVLDDDLRRRAMAEARDPATLPFQKYPALAAMWFGAKKAGSLTALAKKCGFDPTVFAGQVAAYNALAEGGRPDPLGKAAADVVPIVKPPFHAIDVSIGARLAALPVLTLGGLVVDEETGAVIGRDGAPIAGLFAAGRTAVGICSNIYVSGLSVADCVFSGRRAAQAAARS